MKILLLLKTSCKQLIFLFADLKTEDWMKAITDTDKVLKLEPDNLKGNVGQRKWATMLWGVANIKGADQPAHPHSLISAFVIRFIGKYLSRLATSKI